LSYRAERYLRTFLRKPIPYHSARKNCPSRFGSGSEVI
jgi:hypothetical protein